MNIPFKKPNPYPNSCANEAIIESNPIFMLLFLRAESIKMIKQNMIGNKKTNVREKDKSNSKIIPKTKKEGKK